MISRFVSPAALAALGLALGGFGRAESRIGDAWSDARNPVTVRFGGERLDLWSFRPPQAATPPAMGPVHPVDAFILARLRSEGVTHLAPEADRRTQLRRLSFDLTGLPPTPAEVDAFERDPAPDAYARQVERLLASPRYGEHQARLWLDVIRYSDSNGFDWDEFRPAAWRFRDYVVRSFNADKPFDRFVREQLAGDEDLAGPPRNPAEQDALIATGYLRLGPHDNAAPLFNEQDRSRAELMADLVETTGSAFLGLTLSCCRCHDHKTEPLLHADHFRMRAFFEGVKFADELPLDLAADQESIRRHNAEVGSRREPLEARRQAVLEDARMRLRAARTAGAEASQPESEVEKVSDGDAEKALTDAERSEVERLDAELKRLRNERRDFLVGLVMTDAEGEPPTTRILAGGNHQTPTVPVVPGFPSILDPNPANVRPAVRPGTTGRRGTLAEWIVSPANPLTARVFVNRIWQQHFGTGLVSTPNDFGWSGATPTHPELLDWLAVTWTRRGWSVKSLHRLLVSSAAYRQSSVRHDDAATAPEAWLARQRPRRLTAEQLRDALFAVSDSLQFRPGGPPVWPDLPADILQANPAFLDDNAARTKGWYPSPAGDQTVRSLHLIQKRTVRVPFLETFDLPENATSCARRQSSIVAPQALSLLNSPTAIAAAEALAARVEIEAREGSKSPVEVAFRRVLQRQPSPREAALCQELAGKRGLTELCRALLNVNEFAYVD